MAHRLKPDHSSLVSTDVLIDDGWRDDPEDMFEDQDKVDAWYLENGEEYIAGVEGSGSRAWLELGLREARKRRVSAR